MNFLVITVISSILMQILSDHIYKQKNIFSDLGNVKFISIPPRNAF